MVFLNLDEKGERCRDCIETLLEALLLRFGHWRKCPMTNIVNDKVRLSSTSLGTRQLMATLLGKALYLDAEYALHITLS